MSKAYSPGLGFYRWRNVTGVRLLAFVKDTGDVTIAIAKGVKTFLKN
jgi:hypothetical protein